MDNRKTSKNSRWAITDKVFRDNFIALALIELAFVSASLIDGIVISRFLSGDAMASYGIASPLYSLISVFSGLFATGVVTLASQELGKGDVRNCNRLFCAVFYIAGIFSILLTVLVVLGSDWVAVIFGAAKNGENLVEGASAYIKGFGMGIPAMILTEVMAPAIQMDNGRTRVLFSSVSVTTFSVIFDFLAVYLGFGLFGIGLATAAADYIYLFILLLHFTGKSHILHFVSLKTGFREFFHILSLGTEKAFRRLGNVIRPIILNNLALYYGGTLAMTAMSVRGNVCEFTEVVAVGLADTVGLLVGIYFGEKNPESIYKTGKSVHRYCLFLCGAVMMLLLVFASQIAAFYTGDNSEALSYTRFALIGVALQCPLQALVRSRVTYLQRIQKTRRMQELILLSSIVFPVLSALILGKIFGAYGVLISYTIGDLITLATVWLFHSVLKHKLIPSVMDYLDLPDSFEPNPGDMISFDVRSMAEVSLATEQISLFCKGHHLGEHLVNRAAVCFEEAASNIVKYGFPMNRSKTPNMDLRVFFFDDKLVIRIQDNCPKYDICARIQNLSKTDNPEKYSELGTLLINELADEVNYVYSFETNTVLLAFHKEAVSL